MKVKTITCPNCGHANNFLAEECSQCGIHFSRYYEELEKAEALRRHIEEQEKAEVLRREQEEKARQEAEARRRQEEEKAEAQRREQEERERREAEARQREEEERQRREEERRQAEEEARRLEEERRIEAQRRADILKRQKEELEKAEALKRQREEEERDRAERRREEEEKAQALRREQEEKARQEAEALQREEEEKAEALRHEQEEKARQEAEALQRDEEEKAEALRHDQEELERREAESRQRDEEEHRRQEEDQPQVNAAATPGDAAEENLPSDEVAEIEIEELDREAIEAQASAFDYIEYPPEGPVAGDQPEVADPSGTPPNDYRPAASLQARLEFYEGRMIGLTYGNPAEIQNVKLMAVSSDHFQVFYPIPRHVVSFAYGAIVSITENAEGLSAVGPDISPVFPVVIELPRPFFHNP